MVKINLDFLDIQLHNIYQAGRTLVNFTYINIFAPVYILISSSTLRKENNTTAQCVLLGI